MVDQVPTSLMGLLIRAGRLGWERRRLLKCAWTGFWHGKKAVRVSCAHLIRVRYGNKYLLVPSARIAAQMQPPGGVVKAGSGGRAFLEEIGAHTGDDYQFSEKDDHDLRVRVPGRNLIKFLCWYSSTKGRETSPHREFGEELMDTGILDPDLFDAPRFEKIKTEIVGPRYSEHFQCTEILVHEVYDLDDMSEAQRDFLNALQVPENCARGLTNEATFGWFTSDEIKAGGRLPDAGPQHWRMGEHAQWMI